MRIVIPPVTNDFIALFKDTSICSMILITELTGLYYQYKYDRDLVLQLALMTIRAHLPASSAIRWSITRDAARTAPCRGEGQVMIAVTDLVHAAAASSKRFSMASALTINRGEVAAVVGPSGGGKSTLLRCLNGLETFRGRQRNNGWA